MKALTVRQPHAQLIALGIKTIETRSWATKYRGPLVIHAGLKQPLSGCQYGDYEVPGLDMFHGDGTLPKMVRLSDHTDIALPLGAIVASCKLVDCVPVIALLPKRDRPPGVSSHPSHTHNQLERHVVYGGEMYLCDGQSGKDVTDQLPYGDFTPGRFAWLLEDVKPTTERCPACWGTGVDQFHAEYCDSDPCFHDWNCATCKGKGTCDPIPAKGKQGLWEWTP